MILAATLAACAKEEAPAPPPELAPPPAIRPAPVNNLGAAARPEVSVTASSGPIQLTFSLLKTRIKAETSLWYRLEIKNLGEKVILLDKAMRSPGNMHVHDDPDFKPIGLYVKVTNAKGKLVDSRFMEDYIPECQPEEKRRGKEEAGLEVQNLLAKYEKEGLSLEERDTKVNDFLRVRHMENESRRPKKFHTLAPGQSAATPAWAYQRDCDVHFGRPPPLPLDGFTELPRYLFWSADPGKFKIQAGYNRPASADSARLFPTRREFVSFETPTVEFEVAP